MWRIYCTSLLFLSLSCGCGSQGSTFLMPSISDAVRVGATITARILNPRRLDFLPPTLQKLRDQMGSEQEEQRGNSEMDSRLMALLLRLLGVNSKRVREIAFEGFLSLVRLMRQILVPDRASSRNNGKLRNFSLFRLVVNHPQVADLLSQMQDTDLMEEVLQKSKQNLKNFSRERVECIQLLTCKTKPFVRGMQKSLKFFMKRENSGSSGVQHKCQEEEESAGWEAASLEDRMYFFVPSLQEVVEHGDRCDELFPHCVY